MLIYNTLNEIKTHLEESGILTLGPDNEDYEIQLTPDERPFPYSGQNIVTIYSGDMERDGDKQSKAYYSYINLCVTVRIKYTPHDRQYRIVYQRTLSSLSTISEMICYLLDGNNILLNNINTSISNQITNIYSYILDLPSDSSGIREKFINSLMDSTAISPIRVMSVDAEPVPRYADFFTALNTKTNAENPTQDLGIQPSGWSMTVRARGPKFVSPILC